MKKKFLSTILALALCGAMSMTVFAADTEVNENSSDKTGNTQIIFEVDPTYTVTIPATITLAKDENSGVKYIGTGKVEASAGLRLEEGKKIEVRLINCDYKLHAGVSATYELPYTVKAGETEVTDTRNLVATFTTENNAATQESVLTFTANNPKYAGNYSDTVTFTVAVVNN